MVVLSVGAGRPLQSRRERSSLAEEEPPDGQGPATMRPAGPRYRKGGPMPQDRLPARIQATALELSLVSRHQQLDLLAQRVNLFVQSADLGPFARLARLLVLSD